MKIIALVFLFGLSFPLLGQSKAIPINEVYDINPIKSAQDIYYYGIDFSLIFFVDPANSFNDNGLKEKYIGSWITFFHKELPPEKYIRRWLGFKSGFHYDSESVQTRIDSVDKNWIVNKPKDFKISDIERAISYYKLQEKSGLGFVIHPIEFNEIDKKILCQFTFFDIESRKILWTSQIRTKPNGVGYTLAYGHGLIYCTKKYFDKVYKNNEFSHN